jgi:hypothetical protein
MRIGNWIAVILVGGTLLLGGMFGCSDNTAGTNRKPVAYAGSDLQTTIGMSVILDGSGSFDPDNDPLTYTWELIVVPDGALVEGAFFPGPSQDLADSQALLIPTAEGIYEAALRVNDGKVDSDRDIVTLQTFGEPCTQSDECNNGLYCDGQETCVGGFCQRGSPPDCSFENGPCTRGVCNELEQCHPEPLSDNTPCDDGKFCLIGDACQNGSCVGSPRDCGNPPCRTGRCDEETDACLYDNVLDNTPCDDTFYCTVSDHCQNGQCISGGDRNCSSSDNCSTGGTCDEGADRCSGENLPDGTLCDDGQACTETDQCQDGKCQGSPVDCSAFSDDCHNGLCDLQTGDCQAAEKTDATPCDMNSYCLLGKTCLQGICQGGTLRDCSSLSNLCNAGSCNESQRSCIQIPAREGDFCDDQVTCTFGDNCQNGVCVGLDGCPASISPCQTNFCNPVLKQCEFLTLQDGAPCQENNGCWANQTCLSGVCQGGTSCPLGCNNSVNPNRCYRLNPSNIGGALLCRASDKPFQPAAGSTVRINTSAGTIDNVPSPAFSIISQADPLAPQIAVFSFSSLQIPAGTTVLVTGNRAVAFAVCRDVLILGTLEASAHGISAGPGGFSGGLGMQPGETGGHPGSGFNGGGGGASLHQDRSPFRQSGGGGGGFGSTGGAGGNGTAQSGKDLNGGSGGAENGAAPLIPLIGGSGGGSASSFIAGGDGGGGGGAVQISAGGSLTIGPTGLVRVSGAGGSISQPGNYGAGAGGGAGGGILLEGTTVTVQGILAANGGGGSGGRTDYPQSSYQCPANTPTPGEDGPALDRAASGGTACSGTNNAPPAGAGGASGFGAAATCMGQPGTAARAGGGGGGATGRIRINTSSGNQAVLTGTLSPHCTNPGDRCTTGTLALW